MVIAVLKKIFMKYLQENGGNYLTKNEIIIIIFIEKLKKYYK